MKRAVFGRIHAKPDDVNQRVTIHAHRTVNAPITRTFDDAKQQSLRDKQPAKHPATSFRNRRPHRKHSRDLKFRNLALNQSLLARAKHYLGSSISEGRYDFRYLYDALEVALHQ